jgi:hypothetical protein
MIHRLVISQEQSRYLDNMESSSSQAQYLAHSTSLYSDL